MWPEELSELQSIDSVDGLDGFQFYVQVNAQLSAVRTMRMRGEDEHLWLWAVPGGIRTHAFLPIGLRAELSNQLS